MRPDVIDYENVTQGENIDNKPDNPLPSTARTGSGIALEERPGLIGSDRAPRAGRVRAGESRVPG
eukprot:762974-Hanusia_phi.AAC.2